MEWRKFTGGIGGSDGSSGSDKLDLFEVYWNCGNDGTLNGFGRFWVQTMVGGVEICDSDFDEFELFVEVDEYNEEADGVEFDMIVVDVVDERD